MRRSLRLLCTAALLVSVFGAVPASALEPTWLIVHSPDPLLNENGDGYWESATVSVATDADTAHWVLTSPSGEVVGEADLTPLQLQEAERGDASFPVSSATTGIVLVPGTYTFSVTATSTGEEPSTASAQIHVSAAPPLSPLTGSAATIYPRDTHPGVAHSIAFRHRLDPTVLAWTGATYEVVDANGLVAGPWYVDAGDPLLRWDGTIHPLGGGTRVAPAGTYRVRLRLSDGYQTVDGPQAQPFKVSSAYRVVSTSTTARTANATRTATLTQRRARVRIVDGSLRYRAFNTDWRREPLVRTAHRVSIPRNRAPGFPVFLVVRGRRQYDFDLDLEVVTATGQVRNIDVYAGLDRRLMSYSIPRSLVRPDGTVRFRLLWTSHDPTADPYRTGRTDTVGVQVTRYVWRGLA